MSSWAKPKDLCIDQVDPSASLRMTNKGFTWSEKKGFTWSENKGYAQSEKKGYAQIEKRATLDVNNVTDYSTGTKKAARKPLF